MSFGTVLLVLGTGLLIFLVTLQLLRRGRIPVKSMLKKKIVNEEKNNG